MKYTVCKNIYSKARVTVITFVITTMAFAQVGIGTAAPNTSAALDITSTDKGVLFPRLTYSQRNNLATPIPAGLVIWCSDCGSYGELQVFNGIAWTNMGDTASTGPFSNQLMGLGIDGEVVGDRSGYSVALSADGTRVAIGAPYNDDNGADAGQVRLYDWNGAAWVQTGEDINGEAEGDQSGWSISLSADGNRVAIGAVKNDGNDPNSGHVRLYDWDGSTWMQTGEDIDGESENDSSGYSVALSADGSRVAIGAPSAKDKDGGVFGHVRLFDWNGSAWMQTGADIDGETETTRNRGGHSIALSADGNRVAIGAIYNTHNSVAAGHVRIYDWDGSAWMQTGADIDGEAEGDQSGYSVALSADGSRVAIGAPQNNGNGFAAGHVRLYDWDGSAWMQTGADIDGEAKFDQSGWSVALSSDGSRVAIGANQNGNSGHVRLYHWNGAAWVQTGTDIDGETGGEQNGYFVALSADGTRVAIGAPGSHNTTSQVRVFR